MVVKNIYFFWYLLTELHYFLCTALMTKYIKLYFWISYCLTSRQSFSLKRSLETLSINYISSFHFRVSFLCNKYAQYQKFGTNKSVVENCFFKISFCKTVLSHNICRFCMSVESSIRLFTSWHPPKFLLHQILYKKTKPFGCKRCNSDKSTNYPM